MAAITVEDCLKIVPNRFELSLLASYRAKQLMNGSPMLFVSDRVEKNTVVALREIAADLLDIETLEQEIKNNIKNQALFKNFDENIIYEAKKEIEPEDISLNNEINEEIEEDVEEEIIEDDDEDYYNNLATDDLGDESIEEESDK